jgi:type I restriction enzyme S subunit
LRRQDVLDCPIPVPSIKEQIAISSALFDMNTELDVLKQRLRKTQKIKQGMMQELLTGKTRLLVLTGSQKETKNEH